MDPSCINRSLLPISEIYLGIVHTLRAFVEKYLSTIMFIFNHNCSSRVLIGNLIKMIGGRI